MDNEHSRSRLLIGVLQDASQEHRQSNRDATGPEYMDVRMRLIMVAIVTTSEFGFSSEIP
jgi:hypothetical protein